MVNITADSEKNILIIQLKGFSHDEELEKASQLCIDEAAKLQPGFVVINDIAEMKPASQVGVEHIKKAQSWVIQHGVSKIIRITQNPISKMQFSRTAKEFGYQALEVRSMEEAMSHIHDEVGKLA